MKYTLTINHPNGDNTTLLEERPEITAEHGFVKISGTSIGSVYEVFLSPQSLPAWSLVEIDDETALDFVESQLGRATRRKAAELWGIDE